MKFSDLSVLNKLSYQVMERPLRDENQTQVKSIDFLIDGKSLFNMLCPEEDADLTGVFSPRWGENDVTAKIFKMQKLSLLNENRVLIYCCSECGDIACGGITMKIQRVDQDIEWSDFAYENNYEEKATDRESYKSVGPFRFSLDEYFQVVDKVEKLCKNSL